MDRSGDVSRHKRSQSLGEAPKKNSEEGVVDSRGRSLSVGRDSTGGALSQSKGDKKQHTRLFDRYLTPSDAVIPSEDDQPSYRRVIQLVNRTDVHDLMVGRKFRPEDLVEIPSPNMSYDYKSDEFDAGQEDLAAFVEKLTSSESNADELKSILDGICGNTSALNLILYLYGDHEADFQHIFLNMPPFMITQLVAALQTNIKDANEYPLLEYLTEDYPAAHEELLDQQIQNKRDGVLMNLEGALAEITVSRFEESSGMDLRDKQTSGWIGFKKTDSANLDAAKQKIQAFLDCMKESEFSDSQVITIWQSICNDPVALAVIKVLYVDDTTEDDLFSLLGELPLWFVDGFQKSLEKNQAVFTSDSLRGKLVEVIATLRANEPSLPAASTLHPALARAAAAPRPPVGVQSGSQLPPIPVVASGALSETESIVLPSVVDVGGQPIPEERSDVTVISESNQASQTQYFTFSTSRLLVAIDGLKISNDEKDRLRTFISTLAAMRSANVSEDSVGDLVFTTKEKTIDEPEFLRQIMDSITTGELAALFGDLYDSDNRAFIDLLSSLPRSAMMLILQETLEGIDDDEEKMSLQARILSDLGCVIRFDNDETTVEVDESVSVSDGNSTSSTNSEGTSASDGGESLESLLAQAVRVATTERRSALDQLPDIDPSAKATLQSFNTNRGSPNSEDTMAAWATPILQELEVRAEAEEAGERNSNVELPPAPVCDAVVALHETRPDLEMLEEGTLAPTALETYMEGLPASYWVPLSGIDGMHEVVIEKLKASDPEDWVIGLNRDEAIKLTRDLAPEVLKSIHESERPNIAVRFVLALFSWISFSNTTNYAADKQARMVAALVDRFSSEADLQALCHEGQLAKLLDSFTLADFERVFENTAVCGQPAWSVLAQHSQRASEALRRHIEIEGDEYIRENLEKLSPHLAITFFEHVDIGAIASQSSSPAVEDYAKLLLDNVSGSQNTDDVLALIDSAAFIAQFEKNIADDDYVNSVLSDIGSDMLLALAGKSSAFRKILVAGMLPVLRDNLENPEQLTGPAAEAEANLFKRIFNSLNTEDFFALAELDPQCSLLILGKDAQKRGLFGRIIDVAASIFSFGSEGEVTEVSPDCILERLFHQDVQNHSSDNMRQTLNNAISAYLRQEIPLIVLQRYFQLVIQDEGYGLDQFISVFGKDIFEELTQALNDPEIAGKYDYDPKDSKAMGKLRADLRAKLGENFKLFQPLVKVSTAQKIGFMLEGELDIDIPTREEGIASAYNKLSPNQMLGIMRSFLLAPEDTRWFRTWRSPLPVSDQSKMHAGYLADYLQGHLDAEIAGTGQSRLQHLERTNPKLAEEMTFILDQLKAVKDGTYDRIKGPQEVKEHTEIDTLNFNPDVDTQAIADAERFADEGTWNMTRRGILKSWHSQITNSSGPQMTPWAFNKMLKAMLSVLEESTLEEGEYLSDGETYAMRYITPSDIVRSIQGVCDAAVDANLMTPKAYTLVSAYIQEGRETGAPGVKELGMVLGGQLARGNSNIDPTVYKALGIPSSVSVVA